ncbi:MAG: B12-binding domain-containing radical SAM protein [Phycisphaerae bacterium]
MMAQDGIETTLLPLAGYQPKRLRKAIIGERPKWILAEIGVRSITAARRTAVQIAEEFALPVAICGTFPTVKPGQAISFPGVTALLLGEYEQIASDYFYMLSKEKDPAGLGGTWVNSDSGLVRGPLPNLSGDLDAYPFADRELFDYGRHVERTGELEIKVGRGCPQWCSYCVNDWYMKLYDGLGDFVRRRSPGDVLDEIQKLRDKYPSAQSVKFYDHAFAADREWLAEFAEEYRDRCDLPFRCHVRLHAVDTELAKLLKAAGCRWVHSTVASGSAFIAEDILSVHTSPSQIESGLKLLSEQKLDVSLGVYIGTPYESEITLEETIALLHRAGAKQVHPKAFHPAPGTRCRELCAENSWLCANDEVRYWENRSALNQPSLSAGQTDAVIAKFPALVRKPSAERLSKILRKARRYSFGKRITDKK